MDKTQHQRFTQKRTEQFQQVSSKQDFAVQAFAFTGLVCHFESDQ